MMRTNNNNAYDLNIVSHHPKFDGKTLSKYKVDGIDTIGVWGDEPFEIQFRNNTNQRVQVRLSLDGTDVLTTTPATVQPGGRMWLVDAYGVLNLAAWPETTENGARFVFGKTLDSVAANTHGDLRNKGIIAAAVFTEGYVEPARLYTHYLGAPLRRSSYSAAGASGTKSADVRGRLECLSLDSDSLCEINEDSCKGPAVGAGETITQKIASVTGFRQPRFDRIVSVRYLWWDDLKAKLDKPSMTVHPSGFVDAPLPQKLANLGNTPRIERVY